MRLLHTADWHVGRAIRGRSRGEEFADALAEVVGIAVAESVDAVLIAGDLYDHRSPAPEADALVFEALVRLYEARIPVVAITGNHDSAIRMEALARLLQPIGVSMVARVVPPDQGSLVEVPARDGSEAALVACVPFVPERRFGDAAALFEATEAWYQSYAEGMGRHLHAMTEPLRTDRVNVLLAHLFTDGAIPGGDERRGERRQAGQGARGGPLLGQAAARCRGHVRRGPPQGRAAGRGVPPRVRRHGGADAGDGRADPRRTAQRGRRVPAVRAHRAG